MSQMAAKVGVVKNDFLVVETRRQLLFKEEKKLNRVRGKRMEWSGQVRVIVIIPCLIYFCVFFFFFWNCFCTIRTHGFDLDRGGVGESI